MEREDLKVPDEEQKTDEFNLGGEIKGKGKIHGIGLK